MSTRRGPTIYDVAKEAGVAASTVSRALGNPERVSAHTREIVIAAARRVGYKPNALRALSTGQVRTIALLISDITNPHYFEIIRGAERRATAAGMLLILVNTEESPQMERRQIEQLSRPVDAFILASSRLPDDAIREFADGHTVVLISRELEGISSVILDYAGAASQIVEHLASLGHHTIAYLGGPRASWLAARRWQAISAAAKIHGIDSVRLGPFSASVVGGGAAADAALNCGATAVVAHNDLLATGAMHRLISRGIKVPADISVVGFDDIFSSAICSPSLTTVGGPLDDMGRYAIELLLEAAGGSAPVAKPRRHVLPAHLIIRESTVEATSTQRYQPAAKPASTGRVTPVI